MSFAPQPRYRIYTTKMFYRDIVRELVNGTWKDGDDVKKLEQRISKKWGVTFALATAQARVAIYLAIKSVVGKRRNVILSPYTIFDVINMVICAGGKPVFVDLEPHTCNISAHKIKKTINDQTAAVMITHLHGLACDVKEIVKICKDHDTVLIEDAAQALGTCVEGKQVGTFGDIGIFSFGLAKNVNCLWGGMAVTPSRSLYERMDEEQSTFSERSRVQLMKKTLDAAITDLTLSPLVFKCLSYWLFRFGYLHNISFLNKRVTVEDHPFLRAGFPHHYKRRLSPMQARLVLQQLRGIKKNMEVRKQYALMYHTGLQGITEIQLPPFPQGETHAYMQFPIQVPDRHALVRHLMKRRRDCAVQHLKNCADLPCFEAYFSECKVARTTANETVLLPTYPRYTSQEVEKTVREIRAFFGRVSR